MKFPLHAWLYGAFGLLVVCAAGVGACAGFMLGTWWGTAAGTVTGVAVVLLSAVITVSLCTVRTRAFLKNVVVGDGAAEASAEGVLLAVDLYQAAVFPLVPGGVRRDEREVRRAVAYRTAASYGLPRAVQVAAAEALEAIDEGHDARQARAAVSKLSAAVHSCRTGRIRAHGGRHS
ncbi:hypothetical protein [Streptomyces sp. NPDC096934]|uniref:hypothetical protein n=1 Tax=Streptomyces sp. NPDC096934 TaxID=3155551 RepID=UPI00332DC70D